MYTRTSAAPGQFTTFAERHIIGNHCGGVKPGFALGARPYFALVWGGRQHLPGVELPESECAAFGSLSRCVEQFCLAGNILSRISGSR